MEFTANLMNQFKTKKLVKQKFFYFNRVSISKIELKDNNDLFYNYENEEGLKTLSLSHCIESKITNNTLLNLANKNELEVLEIVDSDTEVIESPGAKQLVNTSLKKLYLTNNTIQIMNGVVSLVASASSLRVLNLKSNFIINIKDLSKLLCNTLIEELNLGDNKIKKSQCICDVLNLTKIKKLDLSNNLIEDFPDWNTKNCKQLNEVNVLSTNYITYTSFYYNELVNLNRGLYFANPLAKRRVFNSALLTEINTRDAELELIQTNVLTLKTFSCFKKLPNELYEFVLIDFLWDKNYTISYSDDLADYL